MYECKTEHLFSMHGTLRNPPEVIGETPEGLRANFYVTGGHVSGPHLQGTVLPVGGDWLTVRRDGVGVLDVRATLETGDGALIYFSYTGMLDAGVDGYQRFLDGDLPARIPLRGAPRLLTAHPDYLWLTRLQCVNIGEVDLENFAVTYDLYALR